MKENEREGGGGPEEERRGRGTRRREKGEGDQKKRECRKCGEEGEKLEEGGERGTIEGRRSRNREGEGGRGRKEVYLIVSLYNHVQQDTIASQFCLNGLSCDILSLWNHIASFVRDQNHVFCNKRVVPPKRNIV